VGELEDLSIILGEALSSRTKLQIDFETPTPEEAKEYICELLNHPRFRQKETVDNENLFYPFTTAAVENVLENIDRLTARKINETFSLILELALIQSKPPNEIDMKFINGIKSEIPSWKQ
jgi:hypothetical protein